LSVTSGFRVGGLEISLCALNLLHFDKLKHALDFVNLLLFFQSMVHPNPAERPSASQVAGHTLVSDAVSRGLTSREVELQREVNVQRLKSEILERQLQDANRLLKISQEKAKNLHETKRLLKATQDEPNGIGPLRLPVDRAKSRLVGFRTKRSMSATNF